MTIPVLKPITETPILPQPVHAHDCAVALNGRHGCSCGADGKSHGRRNMTEAQEIALMYAARKERARRDAYRHRQAVQAGRTDKTRLARAMTGGAQ